MAVTGVAVVTGAGSGLGRGIARALLAAGWQVAAAGRCENALRETVASGGSDPASSAALVVPTDVSVPESVAALFDAVERQWGRVDLLVNNAGVFGPAGAVDEVSLVRLAPGGGRQPNRRLPLCARRVQLMKAQKPRGGRIINNGSISAHTPRPNPSAIPRPNTRSPA